MSRKRATPPREEASEPRLADAPGLVMVVDSREQTPLEFVGLCPFVVRGLKTGDYSVEGLENELCLERKSTSDLHSTVISDRERFIRELERMRTYTFAAIIIEGTLRDVLDYRPPPRAAAHFTDAQLAAHPKTIINSLMSWSIEYGVRVFFADKDRNVCRALVLSLAKRVWRKHHPVDLNALVRAHREQRRGPSSLSSSASPSAGA